jgi:hypothetical protein
LSSPVALAFVRIVVARRGVTEAKARKIYLDYLYRSKPVGNRGQRETARHDLNSGRLPLQGHKAAR